MGLYAEIQRELLRPRRFWVEDYIPYEEAKQIISQLIANYKEFENFLKKQDTSLRLLMFTLAKVEEKTAGNRLIKKSSKNGNLVHRKLIKKVVFYALRNNFKVLRIYPYWDAYIKDKYEE